MVVMLVPHMQALSESVEASLREIVSVRNVDGVMFVSVPLIYPSGSFVTVKISQVKEGFRVSDNGFAYREIESIGAERSFAKTAATVAADDGLTTDRRTIFVDVPKDYLVRAICEVAASSWKIADRVYARHSEVEEEELEDSLRDRLKFIFGENHIQPVASLAGASTTKWEMSAIVTVSDHLAVFQAVTNYAGSVYKATSAFHDLASLDVAPKRIAVVRDKKLFGSKLALIAQAASVIQDNVPDETFRRVAA